MEDPTTTPEAEVTTGAEQAQPVQPTDDGAATQPQEPATEEATPSGDDNVEWLRNKGIDPSSPEALAKVAEMYRNAEKVMHESTAKASELEKSLSPEQPVTQTTNAVEQLAAEVAQLKLQNSITDFFASKPEAKAYEAEMAKLVTEDSTLKELVNAGYFGIDKLYQLARGADPSLDDKLKQEGGKEALEKVAAKQQAKANPGRAVTNDIPTSAVTRENFDSWYASLSAEERAKPETQKIVNSLL